MFPISDQNLKTKLASIVDVAELLIQTGHKERAADALAFVINHPDTAENTLEHALDLFDELEAELCPRVIFDARAKAKTISLKELLNNLFT